MNIVFSLIVSSTKDSVIKLIKLSNGIIFSEIRETPKIDYLLKFVILTDNMISQIYATTSVRI